MSKRIDIVNKLKSRGIRRFNKTERSCYGIGYDDTVKFCTDICQCREKCEILSGQYDDDTKKMIKSSRGLV